jgi:hypothetical protein
VLVIIKQLSKERKLLLFKLFSSLIDVIIGMKYTALFEILFRTHMNDLILGFLGMSASGLTLMSDYQK